MSGPDRLLGIVVGGLLLTASLAHAQEIRPAGEYAPPPSTQDRPTYLTRTDVFLTWSGLVSGDPRYYWDGHVGLDFDLVDYRVGRINFQADDESVLGQHGRPSRLDFIEYGGSISPSYRLPWFELAVPITHRCRHLSDQANPIGISWNAFGVEARRQFTPRGRIINTQINLMKAFALSYADYSWTSEIRLSIRQPLNQTTSAFGSAIGDAIGVKRTTLPPRDRQYGAKVEAGLHFAGARGALELFAGYERRIDAFPLARQRSRWVSLGFRLVSK